MGYTGTINRLIRCKHSILYIATIYRHINGQNKEVGNKRRSLKLSVEQLSFQKTVKHMAFFYIPS